MFYIDVDGAAYNQPPPYVNSSNPEALEVLKLIQGNNLMPTFDTQRSCDSTTDGNASNRPKRKLKPTILRSHLMQYEDWPSWKLSLLVKVALFKKGSDGEEKADHLGV